MDAFFKSQFSYCPLVWMCHSRANHSKGLSPPILTELFEKKNKHQNNLRRNRQFTIPAVNSVYHGTESVSFLGPKIYDI